MIVDVVTSGGTFRFHLGAACAVCARIARNRAFVMNQPGTYALCANHLADLLGMLKSRGAMVPSERPS